MSEFDGRTMRYTDLFGQRFTKPGAHHYRLGVRPDLRLPDDDDDEYEVIVGPDAGKGGTSQHHVTVQWQDGHFQPDPARVEIRAGEVVTWSATDASVPVFEVAGSGPGGAFSSGKLQNEALVTHVFMSPGRYRWSDADSDASGVIEVRQVLTSTKAEFDAWIKSVSSGTLIRIVGEKSDRPEVEIPVGHTVCWTVEKSKGLTLQVELVPDEADDDAGATAGPAARARSTGGSGRKAKRSSRP